MWYNSSTMVHASVIDMNICMHSLFPRGKGKSPGNETGKEKQWQAQQEVLAERRAKREQQLEAQERGRIAYEKEMDRREAAMAKAARRVSDNSSGVHSCICMVYGHDMSAHVASPSTNLL